MRIQEFILLLNKHNEKLTRQEYKTLRGQAISGDIAGAVKGLIGIVDKGGRYAKHATDKVG